MELALHSGLYVISPGVHGSQSSSTWINHRTSLLPHFGTVVIFPIRHISYGLLKPLIMITRDVPRFPTDGQGSLYLARVPHLYLCPEEAIRCSICHLKKSLHMELVNISIEKHGTKEQSWNRGFGMNLGAIANYDGTYASYQFAAKPSRESSSGTPIEIQGVAHISATECLRSVSSMETIKLPLLVRERLSEKQRPSKVRYNIESESALLRDTESYHFGTKLGLHRVFQSPDPRNMATVYWIRYARLCMIECQDVRLPDERHACWKKRQQKVLEL